MDGRTDQEPRGVSGGKQANEGPEAVVVQRGNEDGQHGGCTEDQGPVAFVQAVSDDVHI